MKVNLQKYNDVIIEDKDGEVVDRFFIAQATTRSGDLTGNVLILRKKV